VNENVTEQTPFTTVPEALAYLQTQDKVTSLLAVAVSDGDPDARLLFVNATDDVVAKIFTGMAYAGFGAHMIAALEVSGLVRASGAKLPRAQRRKITGGRR